MKPPTRKSLVVVARFFEESDKVVKDHFVHDATSDGLFNAVRLLLNTNKIPFANVIGLGAYTASVMMGDVKGVKQRFREICPHIVAAVQQMEEKDRCCCLIFDEMALNPNLQYDQKNDCIVGFDDVGYEKRPKFADHATVFMVRGLRKKWKQPVAFYFSESGIKSAELAAKIKELITKLQAIGIRNNFLEADIKFTWKKGEQRATWQHIVALYEMDGGVDVDMHFKMLPRVTDGHVYKQCIKKMRVKVAAQVLSQRVSSTMPGLAAHGDGTLPPTAVDTGDFILFTDMVFDSINESRIQPEEGKPLRVAVTEGSVHKDFWWSNCEEDEIEGTLDSLRHFVEGKNMGVQTLQINIEQDPNFSFAFTKNCIENYVARSLLKSIGVCSSCREQLLLGSMMVTIAVRQWVFGFFWMFGAHQMVALVTDNAANMSATARLGLKKVQDTHIKVKAIVEFFKRSPQAAAKLRAMETQLGCQQLNVKQDMPVKWNSTKDMFERILQIKEPLISTLALVNYEKNTLTLSDWQIIAYSKGAQSLPRKDNLIIAEPTLLDPRFKKYGLADPAAFEKTKAAITKAASHIVLNVQSDNDETSSSNNDHNDGSDNDAQKDEFSIWADYDNKTWSVFLNATAAGIVEVNRIFPDGDGSICLSERRPSQSELTRFLGVGG
ncbi:hypothetical protein GEV33_010331 [Tenebrio molitor]|uniref:Transposable element P transposase-like RNase H domain-containing protein n=1 Tax=Tenebrio molitor TaxID=7067 RepID=A0A8J6HD42_TENMO|nr:hypothetical protein GEV33_010331 [Tenebrio molitor]